MIRDTLEKSHKVNETQMTNRKSLKEVFDLFRRPRMS